MSEASNKITAANRRWRCQFRCRGSRHESAVVQLSTLASKDPYANFAL